MAIIAYTSTAFRGLASATDAASADLASGSLDRQKRQRDEAQMGSAEREQLFRVALARLHMCRGVRNGLVNKFRDNSPAWCKQAANRAELASAHSQVDEALAQVAALRASIHLESLNPRVKDSQWQPSVKERQRKVSVANLNTSPSASG